MFGKKQSSGGGSPRKLVEDSRFSMTSADPWADRTSYYLEGPEEDGIKHGIMVNIEEKIEAPDAGAYARGRLKELSNDLAAYQELQQGPVQLKGRESAYEVLYKWVPPGKREILQRMMFVVSKGRALTLTATFSEKTFRRLGKEVERVFRSFATL